jgi:hypothetical protein
MDASNELRGAMREAIGSNRPVLEDMGEGLVPATLAGMGFVTHDFWRRQVVPRLLYERRFYAPDGRQIRVLHLLDRSQLFDSASLQTLRQVAGSDVVVAYAYTSSLRRWYKLAPEALTRMGARAALLDLSKIPAGGHAGELAQSNP